MINCLLCSSPDVSEIASVSSKRIIKEYLRTYKLDLSHLFQEPLIRLMRCKVCDLMFYWPSVAGDEQFYGVLHDTDYYYREDKEEYHVAAKRIDGAAQVLDVGCGNGEFQKFIPASSFTGLEFSSAAVKTGTERGRHILNQSVQEHAAQRPDSYDFVTAFQVLEHVSDVAGFIQSCARCVKPGGKLIIAVPSEESFLRFSTNSILNMPPHHITRWTDKALTSISGVINFRLVDIIHDALDTLHVEAFFAALVERSLRRSEGSATRLIDKSIGYKMRMKVASIFARRMFKACSHPAWHGTGQNVTAIFEKPT